jgi:hypothetical protein
MADMGAILSEKGKVQEEELDSGAQPASEGRKWADEGGREKPARVLPARFWE